VDKLIGGSYCLADVHPDICADNKRAFSSTNFAAVAMACDTDPVRVSDPPADGCTNILLLDTQPIRASDTCTIICTVNKHAVSKTDFVPISITHERSLRFANIPAHYLAY
jgi:hypothetical protein